MAGDLDRIVAQLASRNVHLTRRQLLRALGVTGIGIAALGQVLDGGADEIGVTYPTLRSLLVAAPVGAAEGNGPRHGDPLRGSETPVTNRSQEARFGYMFKTLPPFAPPDELLITLAASAQEPAVPAGDPLDTAQDNPAIPAGFTPLGQFIDHDITLDRTPLSEQLADPLAVTNFRSPRYDLDSIYGLGPEGSPDFYEASDRAKLRIVRNHYNVDDLPRDPTTSRASTLGDTRNDENALISQLHLAFFKLHNRLVDHVRAIRVPAASVFESARRLARWHYQWMVVHDFLPRVVGQATMGQVLIEGDRKGATVNLQFYRPADTTRPMMPVEFSAAAYRFGHSMVRPNYMINGSSTGTKVLFGPATDPNNLNGGRPLHPDMVIDWSFLFDLNPARPPQRARLINSQLSLPLLATFGLAQRNLLRGKRLGLPSGQAVARAIGATPLTNQQLGLAEAGWGGEAPLWFYILKEAELRQGGQRLGPVGGRIVGEVLIGLLKLDTTSYLYLSPTWKPAPPIAPVAGQFTMSDLLRFARVA